MIQAGRFVGRCLNVPEPVRIKVETIPAVHDFQNSLATVGRWTRSWTAKSKLARMPPLLPVPERGMRVRQVELTSCPIPELRIPS